MENKTQTFVSFLYLLLSEFQQSGKALDSQCWRMKLSPKSTHNLAAPQPPQLCLLLEGVPMGQQQVTPRPRQSVASAMFLSPIFITMERCQLLTARYDNHRCANPQNIYPRRVVERKKKKKQQSFPSNIMVTSFTAVLVLNLTVIIDGGGGGGNLSCENLWECLLGEMLRTFCLKHLLWHLHGPESQRLVESWHAPTKSLVTNLMRNIS